MLSDLILTWKILTWKILTWNTSSHSDQVCAVSSATETRRSKKISLGSDSIPKIDVQVRRYFTAANIRSFGLLGRVLKAFLAAVGHLIPCDILS
jgi:hypothetical protein